MYTLLIADDEQIERQALRYIVERYCPEIRITGEAGDGASALRIAADEKPDIVLMDIRMPEINGLDAAQGIKSLLPDTCVIMLTAFDEFSYAKQALTIGASDYLLKPMRPDDITRVLKTTMQKVAELRAKQREEARLRKSVEKAMPFIHMSFVYDLLSGNITDIEHFHERAHFLGMDVDPKVAFVVDIDNFKQLTCRDSELEKQVVKQRVYQMIQKVAGENAFVTPFGSDNLVVLLGFAGDLKPEDAKGETLKLAGEIRNGVLKALNISVTIGIGRCYPDPLDMHKSYLEAVNAERQRLFEEDGKIIHIEDVAHLDVGPFQYPFQYERAVLDKVRCGDRKQAKAALRELLNGIFAGKVSMETIKACVLELLIVLSRSAVEGGADLDRLTLLNFNCIEKLNECSSKAEVEAWLLESLDHFMDNMLENRTSTNLRVINRACDYIVKNCHKNLSLEEVAQTVHLSPFYFSRLFKQEKGCNFVDFITRVRIEKAKKLLRNPDFTAVRIATEVGYQDASYFCRVFRQATGMTPNQYRHDLRRQEEEARE